MLKTSDEGKLIVRARTHTCIHTHTLQKFLVLLYPSIFFLSKRVRVRWVRIPLGRDCGCLSVVRMITHAEKSCVNDEAVTLWGLSHQIKFNVRVAARLLRSWVRILPGVWMSVCCECCVLSGRGLCEELITRPEESYRLWCVEKK